MKLPIDGGTVKLLRQYARYLLEKPTQPSQRFVVLAEGRSGSTLLVSLLNSSAEIHCDGEILNRASVMLPRLFIEMQASRSKKNIYGFKLLDYQLEELQGVKKPGEFLFNLYESGYKFVYLTRRNRLYHALSQLNAMQKNKFHHRSGEGKFEYQPIRIDIDKLIHQMDITEATTKRYNSFFENIPHLSLTYEEHLQNSGEHQPTADKVFDFLGVSSTQVEGNLIKLMPSKLSDMVVNHEELVQAIRNTQYAHFLDSE